MDRILRFAAVAALGLAFVVAAPAAKAQDGVTVGGWIEVIGGTTDNDKAGSVNGISRGLFSRLAVSYDDTLNNGLVVSGRAAYQLNQRGAGVNLSNNSVMQSDRMDASTNYAPDVLYVSVGGGFGTVTVGAAAPASCSILPRPIAFLNGVNGTHYTLFTGLSTINGTFSEYGYCGTPEQISYTTATINGFRAMLTWAPDNESNQGTSLKNASDAQAGSNVKDRMDLAANWSTVMGAANVSIGVGYQQGRYQQKSVTESLRHKTAVAGVDRESDFTITASEADLKSTAIAGTVGLGALTLGAKWYTTEEGGFTNFHEHDGYSLGAKYDIGNLTLAATYSVSERGAVSRSQLQELALAEVRSGNIAPPTGVTAANTTAVQAETQALGAGNTFHDSYTQEDAALVIGASYAVGGGLTAWLEYMSLDTDCTPNCYRTDASGVVTTEPPESDDIILVGVTLGF